eukprot:2799602-Prymnesium_polylepis.2
MVIKKVAEASGFGSLDGVGAPPICALIIANNSASLELGMDLFEGGSLRFDPARAGLWHTAGRTRHGPGRTRPSLILLPPALASSCCRPPRAHQIDTPSRSQRARCC